MTRGVSVIAGPPIAGEGRFSNTYIASVRYRTYIIKYRTQYFPKHVTSVPVFYCWNTAFFLHFAFRTVPLLLYVIAQTF